MHRRLIAGLIVIGGVGLVVGGLSAKAPPKTVTIDKCKNKKSGVAFNHEAHAKKQKIACKTCHHKGTGKTCYSCHKGKAKDKTPGCAEMSMKKNPYHITCVGCHKKNGKGPKTCKKCHK